MAVNGQIGAEDQQQLMKQPPTPDPFASLGGGIYQNGGWVMRGMQQNGQVVGGSGAQPLAPVAGQTSSVPAGPQSPQTAGQAVTQQATVGAQPQQGGQTNVAGAFQQALLNKLAPAPVSAQSAEIAPALQANRLSEQRGQERGQRQLASMASAQGFDNSGAFDAQRLGLAQDRAAREGAFAGQQVADLGKLQSQQQMAALGLGGQMLGQQDALATQRYGIDTDAALRREGLGVQSSLGQGDLGLRDKLGSGQLNLGLLGLLQGGEQFNQNLGANLGMFGANLNQQALLNLLGGL